MGNLPARRPMARKERRDQLLALLLGCAISFVLLEIVLRVHGCATSTAADPRALQRTVHRVPPPYEGRCDERAQNARHGDIFQPAESPRLVYRMKPGIDTCFFGARLVTNRDGLRAPVEFASPKPERTFRILLLGDSQTFGNGVEYEETFGHRIQTALQRRHPDWTIEVINSGVDGYNLYQEAAYFLEQGLDYEPDLVLILFIGNDLELPLFLYARDDPFATDRLYLAELFEGLIGREVSDGPRASVLPAGVHTPEEYAHMVGAAGYETGLRWIAEASRVRGIPVLNFVDEPVAEIVFGGEEERQKTRALSASLGILEPEFHFPQGYEISEANAHLNAEGNLVVAEAMLAAIEELGVGPGRAATD